MTQVSMGMAARPALDFPALIKDAALTAFVVFFLAFPMIGLQTYDQGGSLAVRGRWDLLAYAVLAGFIGRLLFNAINQRDIPLVQAGVILLAGNFILLNTIVDLVYARLDPRVTLTRRR